MCVNSGAGGRNRETSSGSSGTTVAQRVIANTVNPVTPAERAAAVRSVQPPAGAMLASDAPRYVGPMSQYATEQRRSGVQLRDGTRILGAAYMARGNTLLGR